MLYLSAVLSTILTICAYKSCRSGRHLALLVALSCCGLALGLLCAEPFFSLHALLLVPVFIIYRKRGLSAAGLLASLLVAAGLAYSIPTWLALSYVKEMDRLQRQYAFESMEDRLPIPRTYSVKLSPESEEQLKQLRVRFADYRYDFRAIMLERLHKSSLEHFFDSPGFGFARRIRPSAEALRPGFGRGGTPILQPSQPSIETLADYDLRELKNMNPDPLRELHIDSIANFADSQDFGLVLSRKEVSGFLSHHFNRVPEAQSWKLQTVELLGLLMHEEPVVYVSSELPNMANARNAPTRPLNVFEAAGLKRLQQGDDLYIRETKDNVRMVGAVRSIRVCIGCHGGERGDLLGAFTYQLKRAH